MDQDGHAPQFLLAGSDLVITPRFSPSAQKITFMSYENVVPQVYLLMGRIRSGLALVRDAIQRLFGPRAVIKLLLSKAIGGALLLAS